MRTLSLLMIYTFLGITCNVLIYMLFVPVCICCASRIDCKPFPNFGESKRKRWRPSDQVFEFYEVEDP
jgi:hypothetical protein